MALGGFMGGQPGGGASGGLANANRDGGFAGAGPVGGGGGGLLGGLIGGAGRNGGGGTGMMGNYGSMGTGFRGPQSTWGTGRSAVAGSLLGQAIANRQREAMMGAASPMAPYGNEFNLTPAEFTKGLKSLNATSQPDAGMFQLLGMRNQINNSPQLQSMLGAINAPFNPATQAKPTNTAVVNDGLLSAALDRSLPSNAAAMSAAPAQYTYSGPKGVTALNPDARYASVRAQGMNIPSVQYNAQDLDLMTRIALAESSAIRNPMGETSVPALQAVMDVMRNRVLSDQFPNTLSGVLTQSRQFEPYGSGAYANYGPSSPNYAVAQDLARAVLSGEAAPVVGGAMNFGNVNTIQSRPTSVTSPQTKAAFAAMAADPRSVQFADAMNPSTFQHTFGVLPGTKAISFGGTPVSAPSQAASVQPAATTAAPARSTGAPAAPAVATPGLPPRTPTPGFIDRMLAQYAGIPAYSGSSLQGNEKVADLASGLLGAAAPAAAAAAPAGVMADRTGDGSERQRRKNLRKKEGEEGATEEELLAEEEQTFRGRRRKPTTPSLEGAEGLPTLDIGYAMPDWYQQWLRTTGSTGGLLG